MRPIVTIWSRQALVMGSGYRDRGDER